MAGQSMINGTIEVQTIDKKDEPIEQNQENKPKRPPNRYLWAMLLARIYNLFPLLCPVCGSEMQVIAAIQDKPVINKILKSVGEPTEPPALSPARGITELGRFQSGICYLLLKMNKLYQILSSINVFSGECYIQQQLFFLPILKFSEFMSRSFLVQKSRKFNQNDLF